MTRAAQDCVADEAHDSDAEVDEIVADLKSGKRVATYTMMYLPHSSVL